MLYKSVDYEEADLFTVSLACQLTQVLFPCPVQMNFKG